MLDLLPRSARKARNIRANTMATYPALNKALVIDPSGELRDFLRFCAGRFWPNLQIVSYLWARGCPDESFDWTGFDLVVLEQRLHNPQDRGIDWLRAMRENPAAPPIVLISDELTASLRSEAEQVGAAAVLDKSGLSPRQFAECLDQARRGVAPGSMAVALAELEPVPEESAPVPESAAVAESATAPRSALESGSVVAAESWDTVSAEAAALQVPGFRIEQPLAILDRGWLGLATDETSERTVALKILHLNAEVEPGILRRFKHEYGILSTLEHPNLVRVLKRGILENCVFIAMEYCSGGDLGERIKRGISRQDAVGYLVQIMRGLKAVHAHAILHRDLKPANLTFREHGTLALGDFGIERELSDNPRFTSTGSLIGDLSYVSPESIRHATVDLRSDLYSAGVIFYHMLTGAVPFKSTNITTMLEAHLSAPIPRLPPSESDLQPLIDGLLAKNPNDRFQSAADVLDGIDWLTTGSACE